MRCLNCRTDKLSTDLKVCPVCKVSFDSLFRDLLPSGTRLGDYEIEHALGRGGFGVTYRARHIDLGLVAIKEFYPQDYVLRVPGNGHFTIPLDKKEPYQRWLQRFKREGQILFSLKHTNSIVQVLNLFSAYDTAYLVMELLDGHTLKDELTDLGTKNTKPLKESRIVEIMDALVSALGVVHQQSEPIYHLDLSPDNVMATKDGRIVLIDFGAARRSRLHTRTSSSQESTKAFKQEYAPPELFISDCPITTASDIFELGVMLHEMLTGELPPSALARSLGSAKSWQPTLSEPWQGIVESALRLEPAERPQDVRAWWGRYRNWHNRKQKEAEKAAQAKREQEEQAYRQRDAERKAAISRRMVLLVGVGLGSALLWEGLRRLLTRPTPIPIVLQPYTFETAKLIKVKEEKDEKIPRSIWRIEKSNGKGQTFNEELGNGISLELVAIPSGSFQMGSPESRKALDSNEGLQHLVARQPNYWRKDATGFLKGKNGLIDERVLERVLVNEKDLDDKSPRYHYLDKDVINPEGPQHQVTLQPYYLSKYVITQVQYEAIMGSNPSRFKGENRPVENVSWNDAQSFCQKLSAKTGKEYRLPSEAEWEYACRAGTTTPFYYGATLSTEIANYNGNYTYGNGVKGQYRQETTEVGIFPANGWGLYDMHGNVWEWCEDVWYKDYSDAPKDGSARKSIFVGANEKSLRGGSWSEDPRFCSSAFRMSSTESQSHYKFSYPPSIGFRVALSSLLGSL